MGAPKMASTPAVVCPKRLGTSINAEAFGVDDGMEPRVGSTRANSVIVAVGSGEDDANADASGIVSMGLLSVPRVM